ncbi:jun-like transcription factor [Cystobasidiomycetes sp. EMM_F5]
MGWAAHVAVKALDKSPSIAVRAAASSSLTLWYAQFALNQLWTPLFFGAKQPLLALIDIVALLSTVATLTPKMAQVDKRTLAVFVPYLTWLSYATYLNAGVWWLNFGKKQFGKTFIIIHDFLVAQNCQKTAKALIKEAPSTSGLTEHAYDEENSRALLDWMSKKYAANTTVDNSVTANGNKKQKKAASSAPSTSTAQDESSSAEDSSDDDEEEESAASTSTSGLLQPKKYSAVPPPAAQLAPTKPTPAQTAAKSKKATAESLPAPAPAPASSSSSDSSDSSDSSESSSESSSDSDSNSDSDASPSSSVKPVEAAKASAAKVSSSAKQVAEKAKSKTIPIAKTAKDKVKQAEPVKAVVEPAKQAAKSAAAKAAPVAEKIQKQAVAVASTAKDKTEKTAMQAVATTSSSASSSSVSSSSSESSSSESSSESSSSESSSESGSDSDRDSDSDDEPAKSAPIASVTNILPASLTGLAKTVASKATELANTTKPLLPAAAHSNKRKAPDSSSVSSSSDESESSSDSDSSDSSSDESEKDALPPAAKKAKTATENIAAKATKAAPAPVKTGKKNDKSSNNVTVAKTTVQIPASKAASIQVTKQVQTMEVDESPASGGGSPAPFIHPSREKAISKNNTRNGKTNAPFRRVREEEHEVDTRLADNSFTGKRGAANNDFGYKAAQDLIVTRGDGFRKQKNKFKNGAYRGGQITMESNSIKFD